MESIVKYDFHPVFENPILIEGLPGVGNVGKIAADFISNISGAKRFASIYSEHFPPLVIPNEECEIKMACNELWCAKISGKDVIFLLGEYQGSTAEGQYSITKDIFDLVVKYDVCKIITLGGFGTGAIIESPRVLGAVNDLSMKVEFEDYGVTFIPGEPSAGIVGTSGLLLGFGKLYKIPSICLMGETSGFFLDYKIGVEVVHILEKLLRTEFDVSDLDIKAKQLDELTEKMKEYEESQTTEKLGYIG